MNKAYVIAMALITFNMVLIWFDAMQFFQYQPQGIDSAVIDTAGYWSLRFDTAGQLIAVIIALTLAAVVASRFLNINVVSLTLFANIFWIPFLKAIDVFNGIFQYTPDVFSVGILLILFVVSTGVFLMAVIEMIESTSVSG